MNRFLKPNNHNKYLRFTSLAFEMLGFILLGVFGGRKLDAVLAYEKPIMTACLSLLGVVASIIYLIKNLPKSDHE